MKRILIVDDEDRMREIYVRWLRAAGLKVIEASDAPEATNVLIREKIDLILLDIRMPKIDGREMFDVIQEYDPNIKVIVTSVYPIDKQKQMIPNARDYYDKSQGPFILLEKITGALI